MVKIVSPWLTLVASFLETPQLRYRGTSFKVWEGGSLTREFFISAFRLINLFDRLTFMFPPAS